MSVNVQDHILPNDVPIIELQCEESFNALTDKEKLYTHYLSKACWNGSLISFVQCSPETPVIFILLHKVYLAEPIAELKKKCLNQLSDEEFTVRCLKIFHRYLSYISGSFSGQSISLMS